MNILLLGGGGFIGRHMAVSLQDSHDVTLYDRDCTNIPGFKGEVLTGDIRADKHISDLIKVNDVVVDLIAYANPKLYVDIPLEAFDICFTENLRVVEMCLKHGKKVVQFSTCEVYGDHGDEFEPWEEDKTEFIVGPIHQHRWIYANAKQTLERIIHIYGTFNGLEYTIIRPFNFVGHDIDFLPSEHEGCPRVFSHFIDALKNNSEIQLVNGGEQQRAYTYIDDAIDCINRIISHPIKSKNEVFNIGSPKNETTIRALAELMIRIYRDNNWGTYTSQLVNTPGEQFYGKGYADITRRIPCVAKAKRLLHWEPTTDLYNTVKKSMEPWFTS